MNHEQTTAAAGSNQATNASTTNSEKQHAPVTTQEQNQTKQEQNAADKIKELEARLTDLNIKYETLKQTTNAKPLEYPPVVDTNKLPEYIKALKTQWGLK